MPPLVISRSNVAPQTTYFMLPTFNLPPLRTLRYVTLDRKLWVMRAPHSISPPRSCGRDKGTGVEHSPPDWDDNQNKKRHELRQRRTRDGRQETRGCEAVRGEGDLPASWTWRNGEAHDHTDKVPAKRRRHAGIQAVRKRPHCPPDSIFQISPRGGNKSP